MQTKCNLEGSQVLSNTPLSPDPSYTTPQLRDHCVPPLIDTTRSPFNREVMYIQVY